MLYASLVMVLLGGTTHSLCGQQAGASSRKLPSAEKIVAGYLKALGGKKRVAAIRDATYEWQIQLGDRMMGIAKTQSKAPASLRSEMTFGNGQLTSAANARSAWLHGLDGKLQTLTGAEAAAAKLQAALDAGRLGDIKKSNVLAHVVSVEQLETGPAYVVEFSLRNGARLRYLFSTTTKLLVSIEDDARKTTTRFAEYRLEGNVLEPHRVSTNSGTGDLTFILQRASYNTGLTDSIFDPPLAADAVDVVALLREVSRNQDELEKRFSEYSFLKKETDREISGKGEVKKETVKVYEVFPIANREPVMKLISEDGTPLSAERAAKEQKRVEEELAKAEREKDKDEQKVQKRRAEQERKKAAKGKEEDDDVEISQFLRIHEFVSPRRERFRDRDAVVFDFRARPGFKPSNRQEDLISKLVGVVWIDPADKQVMRLEAKLAEGFKMGGGLLVNLRPGAAVVMEQTRMVEGVWLPRLAQINLSVKVLVFGGGDFNKTLEWSDYKHFSGDVGDYKLDAPKTEAPTDKKP
ncbi:MAG TPA: hypothetical protein DHU55_08645 [Blastocatellia bacterium]|jgi:hypothetical protein|nr:hypothetical protein [Blastocatellia bacterium]HCX29819.1 hypothetical protein [Blastocatellia bacterium]